MLLPRSWVNNTYSTPHFLKCRSQQGETGKIIFTSGDSKGYLDPNLNSSWNFSPSYNVPKKQKYKQYLIIPVNLLHKYINNLKLTLSCDFLSVVTWGASLYSWSTLFHEAGFFLSNSVSWSRLLPFQHPNWFFFSEYHNPPNLNIVNKTKQQR